MKQKQPAANRPHTLIAWCWETMVKVKQNTDHKLYKRERKEA